MSRLAIIAIAAGWVGATLLLSQLRWFRQPSLADRLRPYGRRPDVGETRSGVLSVASFRDVVAPLAASFGARLSSLLGVTEDLAARLERVHSPMDTATFRLRQLAWGIGSFCCVGVVVALGIFGPVLGFVLLLAAPVLAFMVLEQQLVAASDDRKRRLVLELPVVAEQIGMLLGAGFSMSTALNRVAQRGGGVAAEDLGGVLDRIRQGLDEVDALREWSDRAGVPELERLVHILALNRDAGDLGRLIGSEARAIRRSVQRQLIESIERRNQQVWIPVTVAALLPGVIFITIPFVSVMNIFNG